MTTVIAFILMFGLLVFVHEWGHLIFAKRAGMLAREFAIGFGPKVFSFTKNETLYTIRLIPAGGYVRVAGEDPEIIELKPGHHIGLTFNEAGKVNKIIVNNKSKHPDAQIVEVEHADLDHRLVVQGYEPGEDEKLFFEVDPKALFVLDEKETQIAPYDRQFASKSKRSRAMQLFAGPLMNFVLAIVLFTILGFIQGVPADEARFGEIQEESPASEAGFQPGDEVIQAEGQQVETWEDFTMIVQNHPEETMNVTLDRNGTTEEVEVTPRAIEAQEQTIGQVGVTRAFEDSFVKKVSFGFTQTYEWSTLILTNLGKLVTGQFSIDMLSGPVGIYDATDQVVKTGLTNFVMWTAVLSVNLGIVNLMPIPALDGGRLLFIGVELIRGKPVDPQKEGAITLVGFALLLLLMIVVTWNDIQRLFL